MNLIEFIGSFAKEYDKYTNVVLEWNWIDEGADEEYSFEGRPSDFVWYYTEAYEILDDLSISDIFSLSVKKRGCFFDIYIEIIHV